MTVLEPLRKNWLHFTAAILTAISLLAVLLAVAAEYLRHQKQRETRVNRHAKTLYIEVERRLKSLLEEPLRTNENNALYYRLLKAQLETEELKNNKRFTDAERAERVRDGMLRHFESQLRKPDSFATLVYFGASEGGIILAGRRPEVSSIFVDVTGNNATPLDAGNYYEFEVAENSAISGTLPKEASRYIYSVEKKGTELFTDGEVTALGGHRFFPSGKNDEFVATIYKPSAVQENIARLGLERYLRQLDVSGGPRSAYDVRRRPWYRAALEGKFRSPIYPYFNGGGFGLSTLKCLEREPDSAGTGDTRYSGVLCCDISLQRLSSLLDEVVQQLGLQDKGVDVQAMVIEQFDALPANTGEPTSYYGVAASDPIFLSYATYSSRRTLVDAKSPVLQSVGNAIRKRSDNGRRELSYLDLPTRVGTANGDYNLLWGPLTEENTGVRWYIGLATKDQEALSPWESWVAMVGLLMAGGGLGVTLRELARSLSREAVALLATTEADRCGRQFAEDLAHDVRSPIFNADLAATTLASLATTSKSKTELMRIRKLHTHVMQLADNVLEVSQYEMHKKELPQEVVSLSQIVEECVELESPLAGRKQLPVRVQIDQNVPNVFVTHKGSFVRVLTNLLSNSFRYTDSGEVLCRVSISSDKVLIEVSDTGVGISEELLARLKLGSETPHEFKGLGYGLSISRRLAAVLGGSLEAERRKDGGTTFVLALPLREPGATPAKTNPESTGPELPTDACVLLADDDEETRAGLSQLLGAKVVAVGDGEQAVKRMVEVAPDIIVLDYSMPLLDGREACRRIRLRGFKKPVVIYSRNNDPDLRQQSLDAGASEFIQVNKGSEEFANEIRKILRSFRTPASPEWTEPLVATLQQLEPDAREFFLGRAETWLTRLALGEVRAVKRELRSLVESNAYGRLPSLLLEHDAVNVDSLTLVQTLCRNSSTWTPPEQCKMKM